MKPQPVKFNPADAFRDVTFSVDVVVKWTWRIRLGLWLMRLGCRLTGINWDEKNDNP